MKSSTLVALSFLSFVAGCKDDPPPPTPAPSEANTAAEGQARAPKVHPGGLMAVNPAVRRAIMQPLLAKDAGDETEAGAEAGAPAAVTQSWSFDKDKADEAPASFEFSASAGKPGKWVVKADPAAPSAPNVLAQLDADKTDTRFLTAVLAEPTLRDGRVSVRCRPVSGKVEQACGLVARFKDAKNYYVARANALDKDVNLYVVKDGKRTLVGGTKGGPFGDGWHELRLEAKGEHFEVFWDGARVYTGDDKTFPDAGRVGLWTRADSVTYFDELTVMPQ
jgi:hypothetical protein